MCTCVYKSARSIYTFFFKNEEILTHQAQTTENQVKQGMKAEFV